MRALINKILHWLDWGRRLAINLAFLGLITAVVTAAVLSRSPGIDDQTVLVLQLKGPLVESPADARRERILGRLFGSATGDTVSLPDVVHALKRAAKDPKIAQALVLLDGFEGGGIASLDELAMAFSQFRASGKPLIAWATRYDQRQFRVAAEASEVILHPMGEVLITGLGGRQNYYRDALDRLGVSANLIRVGEFKSAAEPFVARGPSPEALQATTLVVDALWNHYRTSMERARKLDSGAIVQALNDLPGSLSRAGGDAAGLAKSLGLVDSLMPYADLRERLIREGVRDEDHKSFRQVGLAAYLRMNPPGDADDEGSDDDDSNLIGVLVAEGEINEGEASSGAIGGRVMAARIREAREDKRIKAIVLRIDSPGGSAVGSELIRHELELTRQAGKPVVASMGDLAASGGYWIALSADRILAHPATITGSIGVFALLPTGQVLLDRLSVRTGGYRTGWLVGGFDPRVDLDPRIRELVQSRINRIYDDFIALSAKARRLEASAVNRVAGGRIWSGEQALERGLVDELGGLDQAIQLARQLVAKDKEGAPASVRYLKPRRPWLESLWQRWLGNLIDALLAGPQSGEVAESDGHAEYSPFALRLLLSAYPPHEGHPLAADRRLRSGSGADAGLATGLATGLAKGRAEAVGLAPSSAVLQLQRDALWLASVLTTPGGSGALAHCLCAAEP
jgi:protease-4